MCGIAPWHVYQLCKNPFDGGFGYTPQQVGDLTLDQIYMLFSDQANLRRRDVKIRTMESLEGISLLQKDGTIHGRSESGELIKGQIKGKSLCSRLREQAEAKKKKEAEELAAQQKKNRRGRRNRDKATK